MNNFDSIENAVYHVELAEGFNKYVGDVDAMLKQEYDDQWRKFLDARTNFLETKSKVLDNTENFGNNVTVVTN